MRALTIVLLLFFAAPALAQVPGYAHVADTDHLRFAWNDGAISDEGLEVMKTRGEEFFSAIETMLGEAPKHMVIVLLEGPAEKPDGSRGYPHVDGWGRVHLYRYGPTYHDYMGAFAHELVHAMRIGRAPHHDWFFEEGLAELIALRVDDDLRGFPWYGFPVDLVAGHWLSSGNGIPLATMRDNHRAINQPCKVQTYTLRSAFFLYLGDTYGDEALLAMGKQEKAGLVEDYEKFTGKDFGALASEWRARLLSVYEGMEGAAEQAARYHQTPIKYMSVCDAEGKPSR